MNEVKKEAKTFIEKFLEDIDKYSGSKQITIGITSGWITGYMLMKIAKVATLALGGGILLVQLANQKDYIQINFDKFKRGVDIVNEEVKATIHTRGPSWIDKVTAFAEKNTPFTAGFAGGLLIGMASR